MTVRSGGTTSKTSFERSVPHVWELYRRFEGIVLDVCEPVKIIPQQTRVAIHDRVRFINAAPRKSYLQVMFWFAVGHDSPRFDKI